MPMPDIELSDVYDNVFSDEIKVYRHYTSIFIDQIFIHHFVESGLIRKKSYAELVNPDSHPSLTAYHFTSKLIDYYLDRGILTVVGNGYLSVEHELEDKDPADEKLNSFLAENPDRRSFFEILRNIRDVSGQVLFEGEDALLTLANDSFRTAMKLWEDLMVTAKVKQPCHQLILRVFREQTLSKNSITVFEGGAGVGSVLRDGLHDPEFMLVLEKVKQYYFTDISLSLIKIGREALRQKLPEEMLARFEFKTANLDKLQLDEQDFTRESSIDLIILEHVLYDVIDLDRTLKLFHHMLKPDGFLVFTMAYRTRPGNFFIFEYLQSTFQSYHQAKLEPGFRESIGYLTLDEWHKSLNRAGFKNYRAYPEVQDHERWPYGGILAIPSK